MFVVSDSPKTTERIQTSIEKIRTTKTKRSEFQEKSLTRFRDWSKETNRR
jgi:hypothetical protein